MASRHKPITILPKNGGRLARDLTLNEVGIADYRNKLDWRRSDLDRESVREGHNYFWPIKTSPLGNQHLNDPDPILLMFEAQSSNGNKAIIAATRTKIYRYFKLNNGRYFGNPSEDELPYFDGDYVLGDGNGPYVGDGYGGGDYVSGDENGPYISESWSEWSVIGSGFSESGHRWEVAAVGDDIIFNNGVDLPVAYSVADYEVEPLYELREQGVCAVGTIAASNDMLIMADVTQVKENSLPSFLALIPLNGTSSRTGVQWEKTSRATQIVGSNLVNIQSGPFTFDAEEHVGKVFRFINGFSREILEVNSPTQALLAGPAPRWSKSYNGNLSLSFFIVDRDADSIVESTRHVFAPDIVGRTLFWEHGAARKILEYISPTQVRCAGDDPIASGVVSVENPDAYKSVTDSGKIDRRRYRVLWSALGQARRYAVSIPCSITKGTRALTFQYPTRSFESGMKIIVLGAGLNGGNLIANILSIADGGMRAIIDTPAIATVDNSSSYAQAYDMIGSLAGFDDLDGDGTRIVRMLDLNDTLIIYRETGYHYATYQGVENAAWNTSKRIDTGRAFALRWKHTLTKMTFEGRQVHVYAAENGWYVFDMVSRMPVEFQPFQLNRREFFSEANKGTVTINGKSYAREDLIFASDNAITKEIWMHFPSSTPNKALCFDYRWGTASTAGFYYSASAMATDPVTGLDCWLCSDCGRVLTYGLIGGVATFTRAGQPYTAELWPGMVNFGYPTKEKGLIEYRLELATGSPNVAVRVELHTADSPNGGETKVDQADITAANPSWDLHYVGRYFSDRLTVVVNGSGCDLSSRSFNVTVLG